jgi:hypothetical protein
MISFIVTPAFCAASLTMSARLTVSLTLRMP